MDSRIETRLLQEGKPLENFEILSGNSLNNVECVTEQVKKNVLASEKWSYRFFQGLSPRVTYPVAIGASLSLRVLINMRNCILSSIASHREKVLYEHALQCSIPTIQKLVHPSTFFSLIYPLAVTFGISSIFTLLKKLIFSDLKEERKKLLIKEYDALVDQIFSADHKNLENLSKNLSAIKERIEIQAKLPSCDVENIFKKLQRALKETLREPARISHIISREGVRDGASDLLTPGRKHCQNDKESPGVSKDDVPDCTDSPRECEKWGLV